MCTVIKLATAVLKIWRLNHPLFGRAFVPPTPSATDQLEAEVQMGLSRFE